jgi:hypothetical protein
MEKPDVKNPVTLSSMFFSIYTRKEINTVQGIQGPHF